MARRASIAVLLAVSLLGLLEPGRTQRSGGSLAGALQSLAFGYVGATLIAVGVGFDGRDELDQISSR